MKKLKESLALKTVCYLLAPVLLIMVVASVLSTFYVAEYPDTMKTDDFTETSYFVNRYMGRIINLYYNYEPQTNYNEEVETENESIEFNHYEVLDEGMIHNGEEMQYKTIYYENYIEPIKYIVERADGNIYTNISSLTMENLEDAKDRMLRERIHWVKTQNYTTSTLTENTEQYSYRKIKNSQNEIYTYMEEITEDNNVFYKDKIIYDLARRTYQGIWFYMPVGMIGLALVIVYLFSGVGHKEGEEGIYLNSFDKLPTEMAMIVIAMLYTISGLILMGGFRNYKL